MSAQILCKYLIISFVCVVSSVSSIAMAESFGGFGIVVAQIYDTDSPDNRGGIVILHVPQDSEAHKAGIKPGDIILEIDDKQTAGREFSDVIFNSLRGEAGLSSTLKIKRVPEDKTIDVRVKRVLITHK